MYVPAHFSESRTEVLHTLIAQNPFGILFTHGRSGLDANHLPFALNPQEGQLGTLHAHVARANPIWQDIASSDDVLVVFREAHAYISPNWYPSTHESHEQVPTWNYRVAHAHGRVTIHEDERYVGEVVARLTNIHEAGQTNPWKMADSPRPFIARMLKAIVGIEIEITQLIGKSKLSQNKQERDVRGAAEALQARGEEAIAAAMLVGIAP